MQSSIDDLYRFALGLEVPTTWRNADYTQGWTVDTYRQQPIASNSLTETAGNP